MSIDRQLLTMPIAQFTPEELVALRGRIEAELACRDLCEHGVIVGDWCPACNAEYRQARLDGLEAMKNQ